MARSLLSNQRVFPLVLVLTLAAGLLPARFLGWTRLLAEIVSIPVVPFADPLNQLGAMLRPAPSTADGGPLTTESLDRLEAEAAEYKRLYLAELAKVDALERQLAQLQGFEMGGSRSPVRTVLAHVAMRSPQSALGAVTLNIGSKHGVDIGAVAVYDHVHLVGRVTQVGGMQSTLLPLTNRDTPLLRCVVLPRERAAGAVSLGSLPMVHLQAKGNGTFISRPDRSTIINVGDEVILMDPDWPSPAQGMRVGVVERVQSDDKDPLRHLVVIRPLVQVSQISMMALRLEGEETSQIGGVLP